MGSVSASLLYLAAGTSAAQQAASGGGLVNVVAVVAIAIIGLILVVLLATLVPAVLGLRRAAAKMEALVDRISGGLDPIMGHARNVADNADYISTAVRADVGDVSGTLRRANERLDAALDATERRVRELGALLRLFQSEVERTFVSGTSMLRGFRAGADSLRFDAMDLLDELDDLDDEDDEDLADDEELDDEGLQDYDELEDDEDILDDHGDVAASGVMADPEYLDDAIEDTLEDAEETEDGYEWTRDGGDGGDGSEARPRIRRRPPE